MNTNLEYINQICTDLGGTGGHVTNVAGENEICTLLGGTGGHSLEIDALNEICTLQSVTGSHGLNLEALKSIGSGSFKTNLEAWSYIQSSAVLNPLLERNADIVEAGGYSAIITTGGAYLSTPATGRYFLNKNNLSKVRQSGNIVKFKIYIKDLTASTSLFFQVWRKVGTTYNLIGEENIRAKLTIIGINEVTLTTPITAQLGDYIGIGGVGSGDNLLRSVLVTATPSNRYVSAADRPIGDNYAWDSKIDGGQYSIPIKIYMQAPLIVCIGDSIISGHTAHDSYIEDSVLDNVTTSMPYQLQLKNSKYVIQNMGIGGQRTSHFVARFTADVIELKPRYAVLEGGINDVYLGTVTKEQYIANWTTMLDACEAAGIKMICCKIFPDSNSSNLQAQTIDDWMTDLDALVATYTNAVWVNSNPTMGVFRVGGDVGNLWNLKPEYADGGTHMNQSGHTEVARLIDIAIKSL